MGPCASGSGRKLFSLGMGNPAKKPGRASLVTALINYPKPKSVYILHPLGTKPKFLCPVNSSPGFCFFSESIKAACCGHLWGLISMEPACTRFLFLLLSCHESTLLFIQAPELKAPGGISPPPTLPLVTWLDHLPKAPPPNPITLGVRFWRDLGELGGDTKSQPIGVMLSPAGLRAATYELWRWTNSGHNKETHCFSCPFYDRKDGKDEETPAGVWTQ